MNIKGKHNSSWNNLKLGPIVMAEKAKQNRITKECPSCGKSFTVAPSTALRKRFCNQKCKNRGQSMGLYKPRLGTGTLTPFNRRLGLIYWHYVCRDKRKGWSVDFSVKDFRKRLENASCSYCGTTNDIGLDRIDNTQGHTLANTIPCCERCNMTRGDRFSVEQMKQLGKIIATF